MIAPRSRPQRAAGRVGGVSQPPDLPLTAAEDDPDAASTAELPGYSAGGAGDGDVPVGPPAQDRSAR